LPLFQCGSGPCGEFLPQHGRLGFLESGHWATAMPRLQRLPGTMQSEHLFDEGQANLKNPGGFGNR
jgi:hypothetical protein